MARIRARHQPWGDKADHAHYDDLRRGAMDDAFWDEDELVDYRRSSAKKRRYPTGCKGNDGNAHVFVWVEWQWRWALDGVHRHTGYEELECCGCGKKKGFRKMKTDTG